MKNNDPSPKDVAKTHLHSEQILRVGLTILGLSILWYVLAPEVTARRQSSQLPIDVDKRLEAVKKYQRDKSQNKFEYETEHMPPPLAGGGDTTDKEP